MTPTLIFLGISLYVGMIAMVWAYVNRDTSTGVFTEDGRKMWLPGDPTNVLHFIEEGMNLTLCKKTNLKNTENIKNISDYDSVESLIETTEKNIIYCRTCVKTLHKTKKCTRKEKRALLKLNL